jgi:hypothetical protein
VGHFCPPGSGSTDPIESGSNPRIGIRIRNPVLFLILFTLFAFKKITVFHDPTRSEYIKDTDTILISVADQGCLYRIPDPNFFFSNPGSRIKKIPDPVSAKEFKYF